MIDDIFDRHLDVQIFEFLENRYHLRLGVLTELRKRSRELEISLLDCAFMSKKIDENQMRECARALEMRLSEDPDWLNGQEVLFDSVDVKPKSFQLRSPEIEKDAAPLMGNAPRPAQSRMKPPPLPHFPPPLPNMDDDEEIELTSSDLLD